MKNSVKSGSKGKKEAKSNSETGFRCRDERQEQLQADHELFLQAFEKPTQIYRYLRTRTMISPIFLQRTLTFMKRRQRPRTNAARIQGFKIDSLLERKLKETQYNLDSMKPFMTLTFLGFYEKKRDKPLDKVNVELILVKVSNAKKRKDSDSDNCSGESLTVQDQLGSCEVPVNPSEEHPPNKAPALSLASESFSLISQQNVKSFSLLVKVSSSSQTVLTNGTSAEHNPSGNGDNHAQPQGDENQEPATKRRKIQRNNIEQQDFKLLSRELAIYDRHSKCLMTEGEYELLLSECQQNGDCSTKKNATWENSNSSLQPYDAFTSAPTLKFRLSWSNEAAGALVERPRPLMPRDNSQDLVTLRKDRHSRGSYGEKNGMVNGTKSNGKSYDKSEAQKRPGILYQFLYNNNSRQQTEARDDLHCPWCSLNCLELYALLKHLKLSHPRFLFTYLPIQEGARIDVSVSELFDSTYVGNPNDMISQPPGYAFSRHGPVQRTPITNIIVCKPKRSAQSLTEFLEIEENELNGPYDGQRPFVTGHNRLYNYSNTNLPMPPCAILQPSVEDQVDPPWLMTKICRMIDEFSDVNDGEKEFMKMWNLHIQHYTFVGDCQMGLALKMFIEEKGQELMEKQLYRNFVLHLCNLFEFGVLGPGQVFAAISRLQQYIKEVGLSSHLSHWNNQFEAVLKQKLPPPPALPTPTTSSLSSTPAVASAVVPEQTRKDFSGIFKSEQTTEELNNSSHKTDKTETKAASDATDKVNNTANNMEQESLTKPEPVKS